MAEVEFAGVAIDDLRRLMVTLSLPSDTPSKVRASIAALSRFPRLGPELPGRWSGFRFVLGPWRWMLLVYVHLEEEDRVVIVTVQDARSSTAVTGPSVDA